MRADEELLALAAKLDAAADWAETEQPKGILSALMDAAEDAGRSFSGSWLGYHSRVYYHDMAKPPPGAWFSQMFGLRDTLVSETVGDWRIQDPDAVKAHIRKSAGDPDLSEIRRQERTTAAFFRKSQSDIGSILAGELAKGEDNFLERLVQDVESTQTRTASEMTALWRPGGQFISSDQEAIGGGVQLPPHVAVMAEVGSLNSTFVACRQLAETARKAGSHLARKIDRQVAAARIGTNVFIGHGRSSAWRELKDFVKDRLGLPFDEFNRVPVAGVTNIARLSQMMDAAAVAFVVMTAEDEQRDGKLQARMNVIHEVGLFQGRLGFTKGIVMLEEGCEEFSNIQGLGQIRFPAGRISAAFEEVRQVLEREGVLATD